MENLVEQVNEKFLKAILLTQDPVGLGILTSAYRDFAHVARAMLDMGYREDPPFIDEDCPF